MQIYLPIAGLPLSIVLLLAMGSAVGVLSGLFGIGGGFLLTPMLILIGVPPAVAIGTGASLVVASSISGAIGHWQRGNVDIRLGVVVLVGGCCGTLLGIKLQQLLAAKGQLDASIALLYATVLGSIGSLMLVEGVRAWRAVRAPLRTTRRRSHHTWAQGLPLRMRFARSKLYMSVIPVAVIGAFVGALTAVMGVGGGFILVPALIYLLDVPTRLAIGTALFAVVFVTAAATILQAAQNQTVDLLLALPLMVSGVLGAQYGVIVGDRVPAESLRALLGLLVVGVALRMAALLIGRPEELFSLGSAL